MRPKPGPRPTLRAALVTAVATGLALSAPLAQDAQKRRGFSVRITRPASGDFAVGPTRIVAEVKAERPDLVESVEFFVDDALIFRDSEAPYECTHDFGPTAEARVIRAVARHRENVTVSDVAVTRRIDLTFTVRVNRVLLEVAVRDKEGHHVPGLTRDDLMVLEEGSPRPILEFATETRPLSIALLLDTSGSMQEAIASAREAAAGFVESLGEGDQAMVLDFADKVYMLQEMTSDRQALKASIESLTALGGTAIYDAVHAALRRLRPLQGRKALIVLSDGDDTDSQFPRKRVIEEAKATDVTIYSVGLKGEGFGVGARSALKELSEATGGSAYFPEGAKELVSVYQAITTDLRTQYSLAYESPNEVFDGRWIPIQVRPANSDLVVRTRKGYFAIRAGS